MADTSSGPLEKLLDDNVEGDSNCDFWFKSTTSLVAFTTGVIALGFVS